MNFAEMGEKLGLDEDEFLEMVDLFLDTSIAEFAKLQNAIDQNDAEKVTEVAHSLKGASGNLGFMDAYDAAKEIETGARSGSLDGIQESAILLNAKLEEIGKIVRQ